jgi:RND superfamily putative drug exporter
MGDAFNDAMNADTFYLPPEIFDNADFKRGMKSFISPDGRDVRFIISHEGDPLSADGIDRIDKIKDAAAEAIKGTPLEGSTIYVGGTASVFKDMEEGNAYDLLIAGVAALALIFIIMLLITRAVVAAAVIVGTVVLSLGASFGLSVLVWQHVLGMPLHFMVEIPAGINTGIIRAMGGTGSVVTAAGLVFAFTMMSMVVSEMTVVAQIGSTIGLGLLFDTLVIRAFMTPSIAALLGRWFWWPQVVRKRPVPVPFPKQPAELNK